MKAVVFDKIGNPLDVLRFTEQEIPSVKDGSLLIKLLCSPINPGDFLFIQNLYPPPKKPKFPDQIGGNYGAGIVIDTGNGTSIAKGAFVFFGYYNSWAEFAVVPEEWAIELPDQYPYEKAAGFMNLVTGYDLVTQSKAAKGDWLVLTAGHSTVSVITAQFAKAKGINVISVVRKVNNTVDLTKLGSREVIDLSQTPDIAIKLHEITDGQGVNGFIDNVGGRISGEIIRSMALGGHVIINGGMSEEKFQLHNFDILLNLIDVRPYLYRYFFEPATAADKQMISDIIALTNRPDFILPVAQFHRLEDFHDAIYQTINNPEKGKHLFRFQ